MKKNLLIALGLLPLARLVWLGFNDGLTADPYDFLIKSLGQTTLLFLIATLAVTPLKRWVNLLTYRRALGLYVAFYALVHVVVYLWLKVDFDWAEVLKDLTTKTYLIYGALSFFLLLPLSVTSNQFSIRLLKRNWKKLHQLVYLIAIFGLLHYFFKVVSKNNYYVGSAFFNYAVVLLGLLAYRVIPYVRGRL